MMVGFEKEMVGFEAAERWRVRKRW